MELFETPGNGFTVLNLIGRVNSSNAAEVGQRLDRLIDDGWQVIIVDLGRMEHMTSAGFRYLLQAERRVGQAKSRMVLCGLNGLTLELFEIGGFVQMFTIAATRDAAIRLIGDPVQ